MSGRLLVALHDVSPAHGQAIAHAFQLFDELDLARVALLVVPNWHGKWPLTDHPAFVEQLAQRRAAGGEVFLHGYRHDEAGHRRSLRQRIGVFGRTAGSAEFYLLDRGTAAARIDRGLRELRHAGLEPVGFVPPAWLFARDTVPLLRSRRLGITEGFWWVRETDAGGQRVFAPALSWSTARVWRGPVTAAIASVRAPLERWRQVVRVAVHPADLTVQAVRRSLERSLRRLVVERMPATYRELLGG